jgi:golgi SNAP receptor complex member 1
MQVNEKLSDFARLSASSSAASSTPLHTIQRHWDILQDYSHEFRKIRANISSCRERDDLFEAINRDK